MILGAGTDLIEIKRFKASLRKTPSLIDRLFTDQERASAKSLSATRQVSYYAKRFAAKEALSKACGTGIGTKIGWQDICVLNNEEGAPVASFSPKALRFLKKKFKVTKIQIFVSLTDEKEYAMAFAVLTK